MSEEHDHIDDSCSDLDCWCCRHDEAVARENARDGWIVEKAIYRWKDGKRSKALTSASYKLGTLKEACRYFDEWPSEVELIGESYRWPLTDWEDK